MAGDQEYREKLAAMGSEIRARRESLGISIDEASSKTKLRARYLVAVEEGDDTVAPGSAYFRAFLKTYATFLGLDGSKYSAAYQAALEEKAAPVRVKPRTAPAPRVVPREAQTRVEPSRPPEPPVEEPAQVPATPPPPGSTLVPAAEHDVPDISMRREPLPHRPGRRPRRRSNAGIWLLLFVVVAVGAYYLYSTLGKPAPAEQEPPVSQEQEPPVISEPESPPAPPAPKVERNDIDSQDVAFTVDQTPITLVISITDEADSYCWVRVKVDGEIAFEKTLAPGSTEEITATSTIEIRSGKPWVMSLNVNGLDQGIAGEYGPVKDITITAAP